MEGGKNPKSDRTALEKGSPKRVGNIGKTKNRRAKKCPKNGRERKTLILVKEKERKKCGNERNPKKKKKKHG